jgi:hypothetical protein
VTGVRAGLGRMMGMPLSRSIVIPAGGDEGPPGPP